MFRQPHHRGMMLMVAVIGPNTRSGQRGPGPVKSYRDELTSVAARPRHYARISCRQQPQLRGGGEAEVRTGDN